MIVPETSVVQVVVLSVPVEVERAELVSSVDVEDATLVEDTVLVENTVVVLVLSVTSAELLAETVLGEVALG